MPSRFRLALLASTLAAVALPAVAPSGAAAKTVWLCKPGIAKNPCTPKLTTTRISLSGKLLGQVGVRKDKKPKVDCFYVYPTVSDQKGIQADKTIDPELRSIALYQASRYSQTCRVFAPVYRQITLKGIQPGAEVPAKARESSYRDVRDAWREYLRKDNKGRGVVIVGHSQGSFVLRRLIAEEIDPKKKERARLVSALLFGGNVLVKKNSDRGGDFKHLRACRSRKQLGCIIAFSTFNATPPNPSRFGRPASTLGDGKPAPKGLEVLCTNPAALGGGSGKITAIFPTAPFFPGSTLAAGIGLTGFPMPKAPTAWVQADKVFSARCSRAGGANVLRLSGADQLKAIPDATWGLHLTDANIALGQTQELVRTQARRYRSRG